MLTELRNQQTQKIPSHSVFNNWDVITEGWYYVCGSKELTRNSVKSFKICGQHIAVFRNSKGELAAMDGYCAHMGVDLGIGSVVDDKIQCYFHHWKYDKSGNCVHIPAQKEIPKKSCLNTYAIQEEYGVIWIYPASEATQKVLEVPELKDREVLVSLGEPYERTCHHHITMINGIDPQHLKTVHNIQMDMDLNIEMVNEATIDIELSGTIPNERFIEKLSRIFIGSNYGYSMRYQFATLATLTTLKQTKLFGKFDIIPVMNMIFSYQTIEPGRTKVVPIFITKKRRGIHGFLFSLLWLQLSKLAFKVLQDEDGAVYDNIRFNSGNLLTIDKPITKYIGFVNRLKSSPWSRVES